MTDKQIIIDGVDVSGCRAYYKEYDITDMCSLADGLTCKENPNCYYKQLKRKEQECERLKEEAINRSKELIIIRKERQEGQKMNWNLHKQLDQLKAEVKSKTEYIQEQRDIINQYSKEIEMYKKCQGKRASKREEELKAENKHLNDLLNQALKELEKTRETLTEIRVFSEEVYKLTNKLNRDMALFAKEILQKISECEVE